MVLHLALNYRNTPFKLPWATIRSPPGPDGQRNPYGLQIETYSRLRPR
jgi:hypothetical protein